VFGERKKEIVVAVVDDDDRIAPWQREKLQRQAPATFRSENLSLLRPRVHRMISSSDVVQEQSTPPCLPDKKDRPMTTTIITDRTVVGSDVVLVSISVWSWSLSLVFHS